MCEAISDRRSLIDSRILWLLLAAGTLVCWLAFFAVAVAADAYLRTGEPAVSVQHPPCPALGTRPALPSFVPVI